MELLLSCVLLLSAVGVSVGDVRLPPSILAPEKSTKVWFQTDSKVTLECRAHGVPTPSITWYFNEQLLNESTISNTVVIDAENSLVIEHASTANTGSYTCTASNAYGTAESQSYSLTKATIGTKNEQDPAAIETKYLSVGSTTTIPCEGVVGMDPVSSYQWEVLGTPNTRISDNDRVKIDSKGRLIFTNLLETDTGTYSCKMNNADIDIVRGGHDVKLNVSGPSIAAFAPAVVVSSDRTPTAFARESITMHCYFRGLPTPQMDWVKGQDVLIHGTKFELLKDNSTLVIHDVQESDAGTYSCRGENSVRRNVRSFRLVVVDKLHFESKEDSPTNMNVTEGDDVIVSCNPIGKPPADNVTMKINTRVISNTTRSLNLTNVQKDTDLKVVQCIGQNEHGRAFAQGYINVLEKTVIKEVTTQMKSSHQAVHSCLAQTDESTALSYTWLLNGQAIGSSPDFQQDDHTLLINLGSAKGSSHLGVYTCIASNGYSEDRMDLSVSSMGSKNRQDVDGSSTSSAFDEGSLLLIVAFVSAWVIFAI
eukprot:GHVO01035068.1.p1 GENE.GHVO01035068.1~~GHVO01035068.1.p1  ORF type:complete len:536 (+),score=39.92 GHVO01035068.1:97-1704(+)